MQSASFDNYAHLYDAHFTFSPVGLLQRQMVYTHLLPLLNKEKNVLELNCGTGHDAFEMAKHVKTIFAIDASSKMIAISNAKKVENKIENITFELKHTEALNEEIKKANFIFSNFGGLNCLSPHEFKLFAFKCKSLLTTNSDLFFVIMGRKCIWERVYFFIKFKFRKAFRRKQKKGVSTIIYETAFKTWYYSPQEIQDFFGAAFKTEIIAGIGFFVPPSYLNPFFANKRILLKLFNRLDKIFCKFRWTANYADHYVIHLKKLS